MTLDSFQDGLMHENITFYWRNLLYHRVRTRYIESKPNCHGTFKKHLELLISFFLDSKYFL